MINSKWNLLPGDILNSYSADFVNEDESGAYPVELLNTLHLSGLTIHELQHKIAQFLMLLKIINPSIGFIRRK
jgi:hypothetical protein